MIKKSIRWVLLILAFYVWPDLSHGQDWYIVDSLKPLIKNDYSKHDLEIFHELAFQFIDHDNELSLKYLEKGIIISEEMRDSAKFVTLNRLKGQVLRRLGKQTVALDLLEKVLPIARRHKLTTETMYILNALALTHTHMGHFDRGLEWNLQALAFSQDQNDSLNVASVLLNIGFIHLTIKNEDRAIEYFEKSLEIAELVNDRNLIALNNVNIGTALIYKKDYKLGKGRIARGLKHCADKCPPRIVIPALYGIAVSQWNLNLVDSAETVIKNAYSLSVINGDFRFKAECLIVLAEIEIGQHKLDSAKHHLDEAYQIALSGELLIPLTRIQNSYFQFFRANNEPDKAAFFLNRYVKLQDSSLSTEVRNRILIAEIELNQKANLIEIAHKEELLAEQELRTQLVAIICALTLVLALGLVFIVQRKQSTNLKLDARVRERTRELEANKTALERAYHEQNELIAKTSQSIKNVLATQRGLYATNQSRGDLSSDARPADVIEIELNKLNER
jgi:tetratricopeptide (TPR) repeat protein